ncbi:hypothetical protein EBR66_05430 [bacterium]|nr:hypothetical protein [bacterium]
MQMLHDIYPRFAIFQDTEQRADESIQMYEKRYKLVGPHGCELPTNDDFFRLCRINNVRILNGDDWPEIQKVITAENEEVYVWDTRYRVLHPRLKDTWIPVLDFNVPCYVGQFLYTWREESTKTYTEHAKYQRDLRNTMIHIIKDMDATTGPAQVPKFVTDVLKANAIAKKDSCAISLTPFSECEQIRMTDCYHLFEGSHIERWLKKNSQCPICKTPVDTTCII